MNNAKELCGELIELSGQVRELCVEVNTLIQSAGGVSMYEDEGPLDIDELTAGMSAYAMLQFNADSVILLEGLRKQLLQMILQLRGVK